jgi:hypothetical protein
MDRRWGTSAIRSIGHGRVALACTCALLFAVVSSAGPAHADDTSFGAPGQLLLFGDVGLELELGGGSTADGDATAHDVAVSLAPGWMSFVARDLALGAAMSATYGDYEMGAWPYTELELALSAGVGWNVPLADRLSFFPRLWLGAGYIERRYGGPSEAAFDYVPPLYDYVPPAPAMPSAATISGWYGVSRLSLALQFQIAPAIYIAAGPHARLRVPLVRGPGLLAFGLSASLGVFF